MGIIDGQWSEQRLNGDSVDSRYLDISTVYLLLAKLTHGCRMPAAAGLGNWRVAGYNTAATSGCYLHTADTGTNIFIINIKTYTLYQTMYRVDQKKVCS